MTKFRLLAMAGAATAVLAIGGLFGGPFGNPAAQAQSKTIKIIVPYTPGSGPDILSRLMSDQIPKDGGPGIVVENRPGGGTLIGTEAAAKAEPDGHTVLLVANSFVINPQLGRGSYDVAKDYEPICYLAGTPMVLVVQASSPYKTLQDLVAAMKAKPGLAFASGGPGSSLHVAIEVLRLATGTTISYVPYGGSGPAINALLGGHVQAVWADYPTVVSQLQSGTLRGLVTTSAKRAALMPDVPTLIETGISKYSADIFYGYVAPAKTPPDVLKQLSEMFVTAMKAPDLKPKLDRQGLIPVNLCGADFGKYLGGMVADYQRIIKEAGIKVN
jgi:tripartite-type tricarboxylate transporter receptor subunit TctC